MKEAYYVSPEPQFITVNEKEYEFSPFSEDIRIYIDKDDFKYFMDLYNSQNKKCYKIRRIDETKMLSNCVVSEIEYNIDERLIVKIKIDETK